MAPLTRRQRRAALPPPAVRSANRIFMDLRKEYADCENLSLVEFLQLKDAKRHALMRRVRATREKELQAYKKWINTT
jgi:hypothetical protein